MPISPLEQAALRRVALIALSALLCGSIPAFAISVPEIDVTVLLQFDDPPPSQSLEEMQREISSIFRNTPYRFDFKSLTDAAPSENFGDLIVVKLKGRCSMEEPPLVYDERGPLAFTHTADGRVLPFSEVECDHLRGSVEKALVSAQDRRQKDRLLGRAMGRVLSHEMYHIFANTPHHGKEGVAKTALSPQQLVRNELPFDEHDLRLLETR